MKIAISWLDFSSQAHQTLNIKGPERAAVMDLHALAVSATSENLSGAGPHFFCAILKHDKTPSNCGAEGDFIWIKCKGVSWILDFHLNCSLISETDATFQTHTLQKILNAYPSSIEDIVFKLDDTFPDPESTIQSLDSRGDRVVVFWAVSRKQITPQPHSMVRQPLQPVNSQPMARPVPSHSMSKPLVKPEPIDHTPLGQNTMMNMTPQSNSSTASQQDFSYTGQYSCP